MEIKKFKEFKTFIESRIPTREELFMGTIGIDRSLYFMKLLENPQNKIKVIHIAGTSGKGSTAYLISNILQSQKIKVGLSVSPHIFDVRERMQINNKLISKKIILKYFNEILPIIRKMEKTKYKSPTFFEINVGLAYYIFFKEKVSYAIMETGLGGMLDSTNTSSNKNKICVITKLGFDHTEILGKTILKIATQKAGIIKNKNIVISSQQTPNAKNILQKICHKKNAKLEFAHKKNHKIISSTPLQTVFDFNIPIYDKEITKQRLLKNISLNLIGRHQAENCSLALMALNEVLRREKIKFNEKLLRNNLRNIKIPGRMEIIQNNNKNIILDGAHNPQKMKTFIKNLSEIYPNKKFIFIIAFKKSKDFKNMLDIIIPFANKIFLSSFNASKKIDHLSSVDNETISTYLKSKKFKDFSIISNKEIAILNFIKKFKDDIVITGSLYFIGSVYKNIKK